MKKILKVLAPYTLVLTLSAVVMATAAPLAGGANGEKEPDARYLNVEGTLEGAERTAYSASFRVRVGENEEIVYNVFPETPVYALSTMEPIHPDNLKLGQKVIVAYPVVTPQTASLPPQITPEVLLLDDTEGERAAKVDYFDENGLSSDAALKLNLNEETDMIDLAGNKLSTSDTEGQNLLVFYSITTRSEPPQTPPDKVVYLDVKPREQAAAEEASGEPQEQAEIPEPEAPRNGADILAALNVYEYEGLRVVKLRDVAELLGYSVSWDDATKLVTLMKNPYYFILGIGQMEFACNDQLYYFDAAPFLVDDYTYVEERFVEDLLQ